MILYLVVWTLELNRIHLKLHLILAEEQTISYGVLVL